MLGNSPLSSKPLSSLGSSGTSDNITGASTISAFTSSGTVQLGNTLSGSGAFAVFVSSGTVSAASEVINGASVIGAFISSASLKAALVLTGNQTIGAFISSDVAEEGNALTGASQLGSFGIVLNVTQGEVISGAESLGTFTSAAAVYHGVTVIAGDTLYDLTSVGTLAQGAALYGINNLGTFTSSATVIHESLVYLAEQMAPFTSSAWLLNSPHSFPVSHLVDADQMTADAVVELFKVILTDGTQLYLKSNNTIVWQGNTWEGIGINFTGVLNSSEGEVSRPQMTVMNPLGIFSSFILAGTLEAATVLRYRVLGINILNDLPIYVQQSWRISRIATVTNTIVTFEMREDIDGPNFNIPARLFVAPDFPTVNY